MNARILVTGIAALLLPATLHAANRFWIDPLGGSFTATTNWSATSGGAGGASVPIAADVANFTLGANYSVSFSGATTNLALDVDNGTVTFALNGSTYTTTGSFGTDIAAVQGQSARLTILDGTLTGDGSGDSVTVGAAGTGFLTIGQDGVVGDVINRNSLTVGGQGNGTLTVNENGRINGQALNIGASATGLLSISGTRAIADFSANTTVGLSATGSLNVTNGGTFFSTSSVTMGSGAIGEGSIIVNGIGSSFTSGVLTVGSLGSGTLTVSAGAFLSGTTGLLADSPSGSGAATIDGANSRWDVSNGLGVGGGGIGSLTISRGGMVSTGFNSFLGFGSGSVGRTTVTGDASRWVSTADLLVGVSGVGEMTISNRATATFATINLGQSATGEGSIAVTGTGSILTANQNLNVAGAGDGTLSIADGGEVYVGADLTISNPAGAAIGTVNLDGGAIYVGGNFTNAGVLNFADGLLRIAGDFSPSAASAEFIVNGTDFLELPTLDLVGAGATQNVSTLTVASTRRAQLNLRHGRVVDLGSGDLQIAVAAGAEGTVNIESGGQLRTTGNVAVGGTASGAGGAGTLTIRNGSVDAGALHLHGGGIVDFEGGLLAVDSFAELDGEFRWTAGELRFDAALTTLSNALISGLLGPDAILGPGQSITTAAAAQIVVLMTPLVVNGGQIAVETLQNDSAIEIRSGSVVSMSASNNGGLIVLANPLASFGGKALVNDGTIRGTGILTGDLTNSSTGRIETISGERLILDGASISNAGTISVIGGELQGNAALVNQAGTGLISARDAILRFTDVTNNSGIAFSNGTVDFYGDLTQNVGGRITVSNGGIANFYDDVVIAAGANDVQATALGDTISRVAFFGSYNGGITGGGQAFIEGDHRPGNSPALVTFGGDVVYGPFSSIEMELASTARGTGYDAIDVAGTLTLDGTLDVVLLDAFEPQPGHVFNLFDWGTLDGTFQTVNLPDLQFDYEWDATRLYDNGTLIVIPEPSAAGLAFFGVSFFGLFRRHPNRPHSFRPERIVETRGCGRR